MSLSPQQPYDGQQARDRKRPLLALLVLVAAVAGLALLSWNYARTVGQVGPVGVSSPTSTPPLIVAISPTAAPTRGSALISPTSRATATAVAVQSPTMPAGEETLRILQETDVPERDLYSIAARLRNDSLTPVPRTVDRPPGDYQVGHKDVFNLSDLVSKRYYTVTASIHLVTEHAYWYVQDGRSVDRVALERIGRAFEEQIYPTNRALFGSEWTPGVDNDSRITVLFASIAGAGGYFSSADAYTTYINPYSNQREIIYINIDTGWAGVESTLAHEFQHMIHWHQRPNHDVWLNEGAAVLASAVNGYDVLGVDASFMENPDVQLNAWKSSPSESVRHYGASFLFLDYLRAHFGGEGIISAVVAAPGQGTDAIDNALAEVGRSERFVDVFKRWTVANLVDEMPGAGGGPWHYPDRSVQVSPQASVGEYPRTYSGDMAQFGADYIELAAPAEGGVLHVDFSGQAETQLVSTSARSGAYIWYSNRGDLSNSWMSRGFDLRGVRSATLNFHLWMDIEDDFDYGYVEVSTDGGRTWDTLEGRYTTNDNPNGNNFGNGYTGRSTEMEGADEGGWLRESIDLSAYAGREIMLRFEYITDDGYNAQGFAIEDISIPEIGYVGDAESDDGWQMRGFVRVQNVLPQEYHVAVVKLKGDGFDVQPVEVGRDGKASFRVEGVGAGGQYERAVLIVAGLTPYNLQRPTYELRVSTGR